MNRIAQRAIRAGVFSLAALSVEAQEQASFTFYHGRLGESRITFDARGQRNDNHAPTFTADLPVGAQVCVKVTNAHPALYAYSLSVKVDTPTVEIPDVSKFGGLLSGLATGFQLATAPLDVSAQKKVMAYLATQGVDTTKLLMRDSFPVAFTELSSALRTLSEDVAKAKKAADDSDLPELVTDQAGEGGKGYGGAVEKIRALPEEKHRFNDPKLKENIAALVVSANAAMKGSKLPLANQLTSALEGFAELLLTTRDRLKTDYATTTARSMRMCKVVVAGRNTIRIAIGKKQPGAMRDTTGGDGKDPQYFTIEATSRYERKIVSIDPMTLMVNTWNIPQFQVVGDTLIAPKENVAAARAGLMLSLNPMSWGPNGDWGLGLGLGLGLSASDVVTDAFAGVLVSYRSNIRFGVGYGRSKQAKSVKGATVGTPLPANFGKLEDAVESSGFSNDAVYFLVSIPGLALKKK